MGRRHSKKVRQPFWRKPGIKELDSNMSQSNVYTAIYQYDFPQCTPSTSTGRNKKPIKRIGVNSSADQPARKRIRINGDKSHRSDPLEDQSINFEEFDTNTSTELPAPHVRLRGFSLEDQHELRLVLIMKKVVPKALEKIFLHSASTKLESESLKNYLFRCKLMTKVKYRKTFNTSQRKLIESDPTCEGFDVSLWFLAITNGCTKLPNKVKKNLERIRIIRNRLMHNASQKGNSNFKGQIENTRRLLIEVLQIVKQKSQNHHELDNFIEILNKDVDAIKDDLPENLATHDGRQRLLQDIGREDLMALCSKLTVVNPASMIAGQEIQLSISKVFTPLTIMAAGRTVGNHVVDLNQLLSYANRMREKTCNKPGHIILIEGVAGAGKTTVIKQLVSDWMSFYHEVEQIGQYKFIIPVSCREENTRSLSTLISSLMPKARNIFQNENQLRNGVLDFPILIILDGLDELNPTSQELFDEILSTNYPKDTLIICTSRPEKVDDFYKMKPDDKVVLHVKIEGIPAGNLEDFVSRYHEELRRIGISHQHKKTLLQYFRTTGAQLTEFWRYPLYSALAVIIWTVSPEMLSSISTYIDLLIVLFELTKLKLTQRLLKSIKSGGIELVKENVQKFTSVLCRIALEGLRDGNIILHDKAAKELTDCCNTLGMPPKEVMGAFLHRENRWSSMGIVYDLSFSHKALQEFYASLIIHDKLVADKNELDVEAFQSELGTLLHKHTLPRNIFEKYMKFSSDQLQRYKQGVSSNSDCPHVLANLLKDEFGMDLISFSIKKFLTMLQMLLGLFSHSDITVDDNVVRELVSLLQNAGITNEREWMRVLNAIKCNETIARVVTADIPKFMEDTVEVRDSGVFTQASLIRVKKPGNVIVKITNNPLAIPRFADLLTNIANQKCNLDILNLEYLFHHPDLSSERLCVPRAIAQLMERCTVKSYKGVYVENMNLPEKIVEVWLSFANSDAYNSFLGKVNACQLKTTRFCFAPGMVSQMLRAIPCVLPWLFLPDVKKCNFHGIVKMIRDLQPQSGHYQGFFSILFPRCLLTYTELRDMFIMMQNVEVKVSHSVVLPSTLSMKPRFKEKLKTIVDSSLKCSDAILWGSDPMGDSIDNW